MKNQAFKFLTIQVEDEWCYRSYQQEYQEDYSEIVITYKYWHKMLSFFLHVYRTTVKTSTRATPYSLAYGMEVMILLEVEIPSLRVLIDSMLEKAGWAKVRYKHPNLINEKKVAVICYHQLYLKEWLRHMAKNFNLKSSKKRSNADKNIVLTRKRT
jgi:hypothetical protein